MKTTPPEISILMPVKNAGAYIRECLDSVVAQSHTNWELICVEDHSTDNGPEIIEQYAASDTRIRLMDNGGKGILPALQMALEMASGHFITRMDADDIMMPEKLEQLRDALQYADLSIGLVEYFHENELGDGYLKYERWLNQTALNGKYYDEIYKECTIPSPCWMIRRQKLVEIGGFNGLEYPEDYDLAFRFYKERLRIEVAKSELHRWRDHRERTSRNDDHYADNRFLQLKLQRFLEIDRNPGTQLILWGAGRKGKELAASLAVHGVQFEWITGNDRKVGHMIHGIEVRSDAQFMTIQSDQIIVAVAGEPLNAIVDRVEKEKLEGGFYYFA